jgi:hypothetical protein
MDDRMWRVLVDFGRSSGPFDRENAGPAQTFARAIEELLAPGDVSSDETRVVAYVPTEDEAIELRRSIEERLTTAGLSASVALARWDGEVGLWRRPDGSLTRSLRKRKVPHARQGASVERGRRVTGIGVGDREFVSTSGRSSIRRRMIKLAVVVMLAAAGIVWYALAPGVASFQVGWLLELPAFAWLLWWLSRQLSTPVKWAGAVILALAGTTGYLLVGGSQWWYWGQFAIWPLVLLILGRAKPSARPDAWVGGPIEGPWGPP